MPILKDVHTAVVWAIGLLVFFLFLCNFVEINMRFLKYVLYFTDCPKLEAVQSKQASNIGRRDYLSNTAADY